MKDFEEYGIYIEKGKKYEYIAYTAALVCSMVEREVETFFQKHNFSSAKFNVLMILQYTNNGEGIKQSVLGRRLIVTPGNITKIIDSLLENKFVTRQENKNNRRENIIKITKKGIDFAEKLWPEYDALVKENVNIISDKEQEIMRPILEKWFLKLKERHEAK